MTTPTEAEVAYSTELIDPRAQLAKWANTSDEWVRLLVTEVITTGRPAGTSVVQKAYLLLRQENELDERDIPAVPLLDIKARQDQSAPPLSLTRLSEVCGVNALVTGAVIEPHEGLTVLYGENGTGKTGYSRIFKALANSRTAGTILSNIDDDTSEEQSAKLQFKLGDDEHGLTWTGELGVPPFTRMSIFDSPAVHTHVDADLGYVFTPTSLALFTHVNAAIQAVTTLVEAAISELASSGSGLLSRFQLESTIYPLIETLGADTDLADLKTKGKNGDDVEQQIESLTEGVAVLRANTMGAQIAALKSEERVVSEATSAADALLGFEQVKYNDALAKRAQLTADYETFRQELFAVADLPAEPDDTWNDFIEAGETYRQHLVEVKAHDANRCIYCRQQLLEPARDLLTRYSTYLEDKLSSDIRATETEVDGYRRQAATLQGNEMASFIQQYKDANPTEHPHYFTQVKAIEGARSTITATVAASQPVTGRIADLVAKPRDEINTALTSVRDRITELETLQKGRTEALAKCQAELLELKDAAELGKTWTLIETQVMRAKEADRLKALKRTLSGLSRSVTALAKTASDQLINQNFDALFREECVALRAPLLKLHFIGREGKAQRRKVLNGNHKPSKVMSEGEQKVLALADFLAEARLAGITAPVIFDDPVSSLDHRRIREVAHRIARLAENNQVIVFTHDILFATTLLALFEKSKRCTYYQITDESGKGNVFRATGPRIDTLNAIKGRINNTIQHAKKSDGEARKALVHTGYSHIRSWCEVFTEDELLKGVTRRYQANVQMTTLGNINIENLGEIIPRVSEVFEEACRYIDAHSQALITQGVSPTLDGLEQHWAELQKLRMLNEGKASG